MALLLSLLKRNSWNLFSLDRKPWSHSSPNWPLSGKILKGFSIGRLSGKLGNGVTVLKI